MKILDILNEIAVVDDGTRDTNAETRNDLIRYARSRWLEARDDRGANPENEQEYVQNVIATQVMFKPEPNTQGIGPFLRSAQQGYTNTYHKDDPEWDTVEQRNTQASGNRTNATGAVLKAQSMGGKTGIIGDRAARQQVDAANFSDKFGDTLPNQARQLAQGKTPSQDPSDAAKASRFGDKQYYTDAGKSMFTPEMRDKINARLAADDEELAAKAAAYAASEEGQRKAAEAKMDPAEAKKLRWARNSNRAKK